MFMCGDYTQNELMKSSRRNQPHALWKLPLEPRDDQIVIGGTSVQQPCQSFGPLVAFLLAVVLKKEMDNVKAECPSRPLITTSAALGGLAARRPKECRHTPKGRACWARRALCLLQSSIDEETG